MAATSFSPGREELARAWRELRGEGNTPARAAATITLGTLVGCLPGMGLRTLVVLPLSACGFSSTVPSPGWRRWRRPLWWPARPHGTRPLGRTYGTRQPVSRVLQSSRASSPSASSRSCRGAKQRRPYRLPDDAPPPWFKAVESLAMRTAALLTAQIRGSAFAFITCGPSSSALRWPSSLPKQRARLKVRSGPSWTWGPGAGSCPSCSSSSGKPRAQRAWIGTTRNLWRRERRRRGTAPTSPHSTRPSTKGTCGRPPSNPPTRFSSSMSCTTSP